MNEAEPPIDAPALVPQRKTYAVWIPTALSGAVVGLGVMLWTFNRDRNAAAVPATPPPAAAPAPTAATTDSQTPTFAIGATTTTVIPDPEAARRFNLRVPISARGAPVVVKSLVIEVRFYDQLADGAVLMTNAELHSAWKSPPTDWKEEETETLEVEYTLAKPVHDTEQRTGRAFYGYMVRVYYEDRLQAIEASPQDLAERFPTPPVRQASDEP